MKKMNRAAGRVKTPPKRDLLGDVTDMVGAFFKRAWLMEGVSFGAIGLACAVTAVGVAGMVGWDSPLAKLGTIIVCAGTLLSEVAASRLPVHAERRIREGGFGGWFKGMLVVLGFVALTAWNMIAAHFGMMAIDHAGVADKRAPLEHAASIADAERDTVQEALNAFDAETQRTQAAVATALRGAFENGYVTAGARAAGSIGDDPRRAAQRDRLAASLAHARGAALAADRALQHAPHGRDDRELWAFAIVLELLKGALVWFATGSERRAIAKRSDGIVIPDKLPTDMTPAERRALKSRCASILVTLRHMEAASV